MNSMILLLIAVFVIPAFLFLLSIRIIPQHKRAIVQRFGRYHRYLSPGFNLIIPFVEAVYYRDIRSHTLDILPQPVITKDNVEIKVDGIIWARPYDSEESIKKSFYNIDNWKRAIQELAQTNLRQEFGALTMDGSLVARATISANLEQELDQLTDEWGIKVDKVEIKLIDPPEDIKKAMHLQKSAEQQRRAMKLEATGRHEAAEQDKLAQIELADGKKEATIREAAGQAEAIKLVNEAAQKYFIGAAKELKQLETVESALKDNAKIILSKDGINPQLLIGSLPVGN